MSEPKAYCHKCNREYGAAGFPDLVIPHEHWKRISPSSDEGGLLCPSCICEALEVAGIETVGKFTSGPLCQSQGVDIFPPPLQAEVTVTGTSIDKDTRADAGLVEALRGIIVVGESHSDDVDGKLNMILIKAQAALTAHEEANKCE